MMKRAVAVGVLALLASLTARAAGLWHLESATNVESAHAFTDLAMSGTEGAAVAWGGPVAQTIKVHQVRFDPAGVPQVDPVESLFPPGALNPSTPHIAVNGRAILVTGAVATVHRKNRLLNQWTEVTLPGTITSTFRVALDPAGSNLGAAVISPGILAPTLMLTTNGGESFVASSGPVSGENSELRNVVIVGGSAFAVSVLGGPHVVSQGGTGRTLDRSATEFGEAPAMAVRIRDPRVVIAGSGGSVETIDDVTGAGVLVPQGVGVFGAPLPAFIAAAFSEETDALYLASLDGRIFEVPAASADVWEFNDISPAAGAGTVMTTLAGLAVIGDQDPLTPDHLLVIGDKAGTPSYAWRNRAPTLDPLDPIDVAELGQGTRATFAADADGDPPQISCSCPGGMGCNAPPGGGVQIEAPDLPTLCPIATQDFTCTVRATDDRGERADQPLLVKVTGVDNLDPQLTAIRVKDGGGAVVAVTGDQDPPPLVDEGTELTVEYDAADDCEDTVEVVIDYDDHTDVVPGLAWHTPYVFTLPQGNDVDDVVTIGVRLRDLAGNSTEEVVDFTRHVSSAPVATIDCPDQPINAGESFDVFASHDDAPFSSFQWSATGGSGTATDGTYHVDTSVCDTGGYGFTVVPLGPVREGEAVSCSVGIVPQDTPPAVSLEEGDSVVARISRDDSEVTLHALIDDACGTTLSQVKYDFSGLPEVVWPAGTSAEGVFLVEQPVGPAYPVTIRAPGRAFEALDGVSGTVTVVAVDERATPSNRQEIVIAFVLDEAVARDARVSVELNAEDAASDAEGELVSFTGTLRSDGSVPLPNLSVTLLHGGYAVVPGSGSVQSDCAGASAFFEDGGDARIVTNGLQRGCDATVRFLARRGVSSEGLSVGTCSWGDGKPLRSCTGGIRSADRPALSCGASTPAPLGMLALLLMALRRSGARSRARPASTPRG